MHTEEGALLPCDLVMKGGIASGVVYPSALIELAKKYRFMNVGGTSAGAIAAAFGAAAESARQSGEPGFKRLEECQNQLGKNDFLLNLFQPPSATRDTFQTALSLMGEHARVPKTGTGWLLWGLRISGARWILLVLPLLGVVAGCFLARMVPGALAGGLAALAGILGALLGMLVTASRVERLARRSLAAVSGNGFGLIAGFRGDGHSKEQPALTEWISSALDYIVGKADSQLLDAKESGSPLAPLTFADLKGEVRLQMVTSNLSQNRPYLLPLENDRFVFEEAHFRRLFPKRVVDYMVEQASLQRTGSRILLPDGFHFLPKGDTMPVVVAVRLSLSFPVLLSAVPLYTFAPSAFDKRGQVLDPDRDLQVNWFSDGGLSSNFPIHFFDAVLPSRPTFGINLVGWKEREQHVSVTVQPDAEGDLPDDAPRAVADEGVFLASPNRPWLPDYAEIRSLLGFLMNAFYTSKEYRDNLQSRLPSVRDRIVNIKMRSEEGGLNLTMPPELLQKLSDRGAAAGRMLQGFQFDHHLWLRFRVLLPELAKALDRLALQLPEVERVVASIEAGTEGYTYRGNTAWRREVVGAVKEIEGLCDKLTPVFDTLQQNAPQPRGHLRITPPL